MVDEPKETPMSTSDIIDAAMDKFDGQETPSESSTEKETTADETEETEVAGADQLKKAETEESKEESEEEADPKDLMFRKGYNTAKAKAESEKKALEEKLAKFSDFESKLEQFQKVTSSPEYVKAQMKAEGYRDEVISAKLAELGHNVTAPEQDDVSLVLKELGVADDQIEPGLKNTIHDIAKIADIIFKDRFNKGLPERLKPVEQSLNEMKQSSHAGKILESMQKTITEEGILDFTKDVLPQLDKFTREHPESTQQDVFNHFKDINHKLTIERLRLGKKQETRNLSKASNKQNLEGVAAKPGALPRYDGKKGFGEHLDDVLDGMGVKW